MTRIIMAGLFTFIIWLSGPWQQEAHIYPNAMWMAPRIVQLVWHSTDTSEACAFLRHENVDTPLGCVQSVVGRNERIVEADFVVGDILWVLNQGQALPLPKPTFFFFPFAAR